MSANPVARPIEAAVSPEAAALFNVNQNLPLFVEHAQDLERLERGDRDGHA